MVLRANDFTFSEPKRLPSEVILLGLGIVYDAAVKPFKSSENPNLGGYLLNDFIDDFYKVDIDILRQKLSD